MSESEKEVFNLNYDSPSEIKALLNLMGLNPRKRWGQNFLINPSARERIIDALDIKAGEMVWEIGPGLGAMTAMLFPQNIDLTVFEIDPGYIEYLKKAFSGLKIVYGDVIKCWEKEKADSGMPDKVIGNLPYNAASAIIASFIEKNAVPSRFVLTVQKEMGDRMTAKPGTSDYSSFSLLCQFGCSVRDRGVLAKGSFYPAPRVSSRIVELEPHHKFDDFKHRELFFILIRDLFMSRRKMLKNNLEAASRHRLSRYPNDLLYQAFSEENINLELRPERLSLNQYVALAEKIASLAGEK